MFEIETFLSYVPNLKVMLYITRFPVAPQKYTEQQQTDAFLQCRTRWLGIFFSFFAAKFKIDAPKENQFTTRWILKAFLPHEMSNLHRDAEGYSKKKKSYFHMFCLKITMSGMYLNFIERETNGVKNISSSTDPNVRSSISNLFSLSILGFRGLVSYG